MHAFFLKIFYKTVKGRILRENNNFFRILISFINWQESDKTVQDIFFFSSKELNKLVVITTYFSRQATFWSRNARNVEEHVQGRAESHFDQIFFGIQLICVVLVAQLVTVRSVHSATVA